jgi:hypothetical protein
LKATAWLVGSFLAALTLLAYLPSLARATQAGEGFAYLQITRPGDGAALTAPVAIRARRLGEGAARLWLELYGKDGRLLSRRILRISGMDAAPAFLEEQLDFEIPAAAEQGWLRLVLQDSQLRFMAVDTLPLTLLREGQARGAPPAGDTPDIGIQRPTSGVQVSGGMLEVRGTVSSHVKLPLRVQLVDAAGRVVGQRLAGGETGGSSGRVVYSAQVPYAVRTATPVRLLVFEEGGDLLQIKHLSSLVLVLNP